jgi:hypothetical protein
VHSAPVILRADEYSQLLPTDTNPPFIKAASTQVLVSTFAL